MTDRLEDARARWPGEMAVYKRFATTIEDRMKSAVKRAGILCWTASREKELHSLIKKLIKKPGHTYDTLTDKAGARCVVRYRAELQHVIEAAQRTLQCGKVERKADELGTRQIGYNGVHIDVQLRPEDPEASEYSACRGELQIKTMGQQLWSEMSHDSIYKNDEALLKLDPDYTRRVNLMSGLIEVADREFDSLNREYPRDQAHDVYRALEPHYYRLTARRPDAELSLDIIRLLLPLYDNTEPTKRLDEFLTAHAKDLVTIYEHEEQDMLNALMFQPEALLLFERLDNDLEATRAIWRSRYPDAELERVAVAFGMSFD